MRNGKREISKEHWDMSFESYFRKGQFCGYCLDAEFCSSCVIDPKICKRGDSTTYWRRMSRAQTKKTRLKYKNLIREYILSEGHRLNYITPEQERVAGSVMDG